MDIKTIMGAVAPLGYDSPRLGWDSRCACGPARYAVNSALAVPVWRAGPGRPLGPTFGKIDVSALENNLRNISLGIPDQPSSCRTLLRISSESRFTDKYVGRINVTWDLGQHQNPKKQEFRMFGQDRIRVRRGHECVALAPGIPTLSSAQFACEGALLERHSHGPHTADKHQHLSHFVCLHLSEPAPLVWRSQGKQGNKTIGPGSIIVVSRGTEDSVSFPKPVKRILLNLEPNVLRLCVAASPARVSSPKSSGALWV